MAHNQPHKPQKNQQTSSHLPTFSRQFTFWPHKQTPQKREPFGSLRKLSDDSIFDFYKSLFRPKPTPAKQTKAKTKTNPLSPPPPPRCCRQRPQREQKIEKEQTVNRKGGEEPRGRCEGEICEVKGRTVFLLLFSSSFSPPPLPSSVLFGLVSHHPSKLPAQRILKGRWSPRK